LDSLAFAKRIPSICFCSADNILVLPVFPSRYPNNGQSAMEQNLTSEGLSPEHCKQYVRIALNGVTMVFPPFFFGLLNSLHKLCSEIVEKWIREGYSVVAIAEFCSATESRNLSN